MHTFPILADQSIENVKTSGKAWKAFGRHQRAEKVDGRSQVFGSREQGLGEFRDPPPIRGRRIDVRAGDAKRECWLTARSLFDLKKRRIIFEVRAAGRCFGHGGEQRYQIGIVDRHEAEL
jgi:hypothetical protein